MTRTMREREEANTVVQPQAQPPPRPLPPVNNPSPSTFAEAVSSGGASKSRYKRKPKTLVEETMNTLHSKLRSIGVGRVTDRCGVANTLALGCSHLLLEPAKFLQGVQNIDADAPVFEMHRGHFAIHVDNLCARDF